MFKKFLAGISFLAMIAFHSSVTAQEPPVKTHVIVLQNKLTKEDAVKIDQAFLASKGILGCSTDFKTSEMIIKADTSVKPLVFFELLRMNGFKAGSYISK
jgi:hypothetical protein